MEKAHEIVDENGMPLGKKKPLWDFLKQNIWNILGAGMGSLFMIQGLISVFIKAGYAKSYSSYYGIHKRYFDGNEMYQDKMFFLAINIVLILYLIILVYANKKIKEKELTWVLFGVSVIVMLGQNLIYVSNIIEVMEKWGVEKIIDNWITVAILFITDVIISFYMIIRNRIWKEKKIKKVEAIMLSVALFFYISLMVGGIMVYMNSEIGDKKDYEVVNGNQVIVSTYDDKFVVMNCIVDGENLSIEKGKCSLIQTEDLEVTYYEFKQVICK